MVRENKCMLPRRACRMNMLVGRRGIGFRRARVRSYNLQQHSFHNCTWDSQQQTTCQNSPHSLGSTLSQLHSPVAFLPHEHLTPVEDGVTDVPCVVKSMGMEDILMFQVVFLKEFEDWLFASLVWKSVADDASSLVLCCVLMVIGGPIRYCVK